MSNLTTLSDTKVYLNISGNEDDDLLNILITQSSAMIKRELGTDIVATDYTNEIYNGNGEYRLMLQQYPLIRVDRLNIGREKPCKIKNNGSATHATVGVTDKDIILREAVDGTWSTTKVAFSDYSTLNDVDTQINSLSNWESLLTSTYSGYPSTELMKAPAKTAYNTYAYLHVPDRTEADYDIISYQNSILYSPYGFEHGEQNISVSYRAGWETIPDVLESACQELVKLLFDHTKTNALLEEEQIGDYSYKKGTFVGSVFVDWRFVRVYDISNTVTQKLSYFKRLLIY